jgi:hypothetical protein
MRYTWGPVGRAQFGEWAAIEEAIVHLLDL